MSGSNQDQHASLTEPISEPMKNVQNPNTAYINLSQQPITVEDLPSYDYGFREPLLSNNKWFTPEQATWKITLPVFGRLRFVKDVLGIAAMALITSYWFFNAMIHAFHLLVPAYNHGYSSLWLIIVYVCVGLLTLASLLRTSTKNPGALDTFSFPDDPNNTASWTTCQKCHQSRPPEAHHCRRCGQCVRKMDHHCPWVNNCIGEDNRYVFILLLVYATVMAVMTCTLDVLVLYSYLPCVECHERTYVFVSMITAIKFSLISSFLLSVGGSGLLVAQHLSILFQLPTMEMNRLQMNIILHGKYPTKMPELSQNLWGAYVEVCGVGWWGWWPIPCRRRRRAGVREDGFYV